MERLAASCEHKRRYFLYRYVNQNSQVSKQDKMKHKIQAIYNKNNTINSR